MLKKVSQILDQKNYQSKSAKVIQASHICWVADQVGRKYHFKAKTYKKGVLKVVVLSGILISEIRIGSNKIIKEINQKLGQNIVRKILPFI